MRLPVAFAAVLFVTPTFASEISIPQARQGAESMVREILARDLSTVLTVNEKANDDKLFMFPDLLKLFRKGARDLDSDPYSATQDNTGYRLTALNSIVKSTSNVAVTVNFSVDGAPDAHPKIAYDMRLIGSRWYVYDITYLNDRKTLRGILSGAR